MPLENVWTKVSEDITVNSIINDWPEDDEPLMELTTVIEIDDGTELVVDNGIINAESGFILLFDEQIVVFDCSNAKTDDEWFWDIDGREIEFITESS